MGRVIVNAVAGQIVDAPPMKRCPGCGETRPLDDFWRNRSRYDGRSTYCRACRHLANSTRPKAMLPTEPLVGPLREATGERGNRGPRSGEPGIHRLATQMAAMYGGPIDRYRVQIDCILRGVLSRIHFASADRIALAIGRHPAEIWRGEW